MELLQLRYFLMVAKTEHMTSAAQKMNVSQPVLSKSIRNLEEELGVPLFERVGRRIRLNDYGRLFQKNISKVINLLDHSVQEVQEMEEEGIYEIRLQITAAVELSTALIRDFSKQHPRVTFKLDQHESGDIWEKPEETDLIITSSRREDIRSNSVTLFSEEIALAVPDGHPLSRFDSIGLRDLEQETFVDRRPGTNFRGLTDSFFRDVDIWRNVSFECDSPNMVLQLIQGGLGIGFIGTKSLEVSGVHLLHINDVKCERFVEIQWPENYYRNQGVRDFVRFAQKFFKKYR